MATRERQTGQAFLMPVCSTIAYQLRSKVRADEQLVPTFPRPAGNRQRGPLHLGTNRTREMLNKLSEAERAYLAGFIDGEGCIYIGVSKQSRKAGKSTSFHRLDVIVSQNNKPCLEYWQQKTGLGRIFQSSRDVQSYQWRCVGRDAERLLRLVFDFLMVKRDQAEIAFEFRKTKGQEPLRGHSKTSPHLVKKRDEFRNKLLALKKGEEFVALEDGDEYDPFPEQMKLF